MTERSRNWIAYSTMIAAMVAMFGAGAAWGEVRAHVTTIDALSRRTHQIERIVSERDGETRAFMAEALRRLERIERSLDKE